MSNRMRLVSMLVGAGLLLLAVATAPCRAQLRGATAPVMLGGTGLAAPEDARAVEANPAALGFLDTWSFRYIHVEADDGERLERAGDGFFLAIPLFFGLSSGLSVQNVRPTPPVGLADRTMATFALGWAGRTAGIGTSVHWLSSQDGSLSGVTTFDLAMSFRPAPPLAISLLARDLNGPIEFGAGDLPASFVLAAALRPSGTRVVTLDVAGSVDTDGVVGVRGAAEVEVPYIGHAFGAAELNGVEERDPELRLTAGLAVDWGGLGVGGGVVAGDGTSDPPAWLLSVGLSGASRGGIPLPRYVADVEVEGAGARGIVSLVTRLDRALHDDRVAGVYLRLRGSNLGSAYAQEVRWMVDRLTDAGKPVVCHLDVASGAEVYACGGASHVSFDPAGNARLLGPSATILLLGDVLRNAGVRADFVRIGRFKSAPEQLTNRRSSEGAREQREALYQDVYDRIVADLSRDWEEPPPRVRELIDGGPYVSSELLANGIADSIDDDLDMDETLREAFGGPFAYLENTPRTLPRRWGRPGRVGVVMIDGDIVDGENVDVPFLGIRMSGGRTVAEAIETMAADRSVDAIVLRVDSPGGSVLASDQIWRAIMRARRRKPVICSMGAVAASGGYYVASAADEIWADPTTVTGSIGVFVGKVDFAPLAERLDIGMERFQRGRRAGLESLYRPFTPDERAMLADKIRMTYRMFLRRIHAGRDMEPGRVHDIAQGRVWSGDAALRLGLVDHLGGFGAALARARQLAELPHDAEVVMLPTRPSSLLDFVLGGSRGSADADAPEAADASDAGSALAALPPELAEAVRVAIAFGHVREGAAIARLPYVATPP